MFADIAAPNIRSQCRSVLGHYATVDSLPLKKCHGQSYHLVLFQRLTTASF